MTTEKRVFCEVVKGKNFMTPDIIGYYRQGDYAIELSEGLGFRRQAIYGVTVVNMVRREHVHDMCEMFESKKEALDYIQSL